MSKAFLVDTTKCQGCRGCQVACKQWNGLPGQKTDFFEGTEYTNPAELSAITWNHVVFFPVEKRNTERPIWTIMHKKCYHCETANCLRVCPVKAIHKEDGWTIIDQDKCIGCGACTSECVYTVPGIADEKHVNDVGTQMIFKDKSHKCNACMKNKREIPACVYTCPSGALTYGDRSDILSSAKDRVKAMKKEFPNISLYGEKEFDGLRVLTILRNKPSKYGLPTKVKPVDYSKAESTRDIYSLLSAFTFGLAPLKRVAYKISRSLSKDA